MPRSRAGGCSLCDPGPVSSRLAVGKNGLRQGRIAPGHQLGFNDLKTIEVAALIRAVAGEANEGPDFREAYEVQRVVAAAIRSGKDGSWVRVADM